MVVRNPQGNSMVQRTFISDASPNTRTNRSKSAHCRSDDRWSCQSPKCRKGRDHLHFRYVYGNIFEMNKSRVNSLVRKYVEELKDSSQLLDLLSVAGSNNIEPTKAVAGRTALYPDVRLLLAFSTLYVHVFPVSLISHFDRGCQRGQAASRTFQCKPV